MKLSILLLCILPAIFVAADQEVRTTTHTPKPRPTRACAGAIYHTLRQLPEAKSFCSSFLRTTQARTITLPTVTTTVRTTLSQSTSTVTVTRVRTSMVYTRSTPYATVTTTSYSNAPVACASSAGSISGSIADNNDLEKRTRVKPTYSTPSIFSGKPSATVSSLCSCLHVNVRTKTQGRITVGQATATVTRTIVPTGRVFSTTVHSTIVTTVTVTNTASTQTKTATYVQPVPTTFNGLNWYAYPNNYDFTAGSPNIDVTLFNSPHYEDSGVVNNPPAVAPGFSPKCSLPGSNVVLNCTQITVVMQGYLYAPASGTYTLTTGGSNANAVDNYVGLWTGNNAYDSYDNSNADFIAIRENHSTIQQGGSQTYQLSKGQLLPVTIIYMNGGYQGNFQFQIITPDGTTNSDTSDFWIPACPNGNLFSP